MGNSVILLSISVLCVARVLFIYARVSLFVVMYEYNDRGNSWSPLFVSSCFSTFLPQKQHTFLLVFLFSRASSLHFHLNRGFSDNETIDMSSLYLLHGARLHSGYIDSHICLF